MNNKAMKSIIIITMLFSVIFTLLSCKSQSGLTGSEVSASVSSSSDVEVSQSENAASSEVTEIPNSDISADNVPLYNNPNNSQVSTVPPTPKTVKITIKEGETLTQIFKKIEQNGVCSFSSLMETADTYDYSYYSLIASRPSNGRCFKLEGYLFPDTYEFYIGEKPQDVIGRFLRNGNNKITDTYRKKATKMGYSMDDILIIASIIQKEGSKPSEVSNVAAVIYNRLKAGQKLQMDSTIDYIENNVKPYLSGDKNRYNSLYNTYKCSALPAGPISNPGINTIIAALNPSNVPYLYFCHDANGNYYYATTYDEQIENLKKAGIS